MQRIRATVALLFALCVSCPGLLIAQTLPEPVRAALARAGVGREHLGVVVQEVGTDRPSLEWNADAAFSPASVMKLVTTSAALDLLGPTFTWSTQALTTGTQSGDVLHGDLVIRGGGDPKLVIENFWMFLRQVRARGIREIRGRLVLDRSHFQLDPADPAAFDGDADRPYNALPDALLLNFRTLSWRFLPDPAAGLVRVAVEPPLDGWPVAAPELGTGECADWRRLLNAGSSDAGTGFGGVYPASCGERAYSAHAWQVSPDRYFAAVFRQVWRELGGVFRGEVVAAPMPEGARLVAEWRSPPLADVVREVNKFSNNVMARHLLLTMAAQLRGVPGTVQAGNEVVSGWLGTRGIPAPGLVLENGSGLSRNERISPRTLARLLLTNYQSPLMPEFVSSLPLAGLDGTMRNRLRQFPGMAHIKTGSLNEVRSVAGYVQAASGRRYAVVSIVNHPNAGASTAVHDALLQWIISGG